MGNVRMAAFAFGFSVLVFVYFLVSSTSNLPSTVATHFNASGNPNSWMSSSYYVTFFLAFGLGVPSFIVFVCYATRWLPSGLVNIPHREFWLAGERASRTHRDLLARGLWLACLVLLFLLSVHYAVIRANEVSPAQLAPRSVIIPLSILFAGLAIWIARLVLHFARPPLAPGAN